MGTAALILQWAVIKKFNMYKIAIFCVAIAGAFATPEAEADPGYLVPAVYNSYPNWPGVHTPFSSSTCFGCRAIGKRSADAEADADAYYAALPYHYGYLRPVFPGIAGHATGTSYVARSPRGIGKRSADADADAYYGYPYAYGYGYPYGYRAYGCRAYGYPYGYARW